MKKSATKIILKRMPKSTEVVPKQARLLLEVLSAKGGTLTLPELTKNARRRLKTVQTIPAIFHHYRKDLTKRGFVRVTL
jgi:hypothetical protein